MSPTMPKPTLLPCPFCGGQPFETELQHLNPRVGWYWVIGCGNEDCPVDGFYSDCPTYEEAAAAWNRRASPAGAQGAVAWVVGELPQAVHFYSEVNAQAHAARYQLPITPLYTHPPAASEDAVAYRLTMRSGVSDRNDNVIGDFNDRITATIVGEYLKDLDSLNAPEYSRFDIDPVTHVSAASEEAARLDWLIPRSNLNQWEGRWRYGDAYSDQMTGYYDTPRQAIDAARDGEGVGGG